MSIAFHKALLHPLDDAHLLADPGSDYCGFTGLIGANTDNTSMLGAATFSYFHVPSEIVYNERLFVPAEHSLHMDNVRQRTQAQTIGGQAYAQLFTNYLSFSLEQISAPFSGVPLYLHPATKDMPAEDRRALMFLAIHIARMAEDYITDALISFDRHVNKKLLEYFQEALPENHPLNFIKQMEAETGDRFIGISRMISPNHGIFNAMTGIVFVFAKKNTEDDGDEWVPRYYLFDSEIDFTAAQELLGHPIQESEEELKAFQEFAKLFAGYFIKTGDEVIHARSYEIVSERVETSAKFFLEKYPQFAKSTETPASESTASNDG